MGVLSSRPERADNEAFIGNCLGNQSILSVSKTLRKSSPQRTADAWRRHNAGRILGNALAQFESRVLALMVQSGHAQTRLPHIHLTRHLDLGGTRITVLARRAAMTNAAMTELIDQCEALGLVVREADPADRRARIVHFTPAGRLWLAAFGRALRKAEKELREQVGEPASRVLFEALALYGNGVDSIGAGDAAG